MTDRQFADRIPAPRPVPTTRDRLTDARTCDALCRDIEVERDDLRIQVGREQADNRAMMRDRDQALAERDRAREVAREGYAEVGRLRAELGAAQELIAVLDDVTEQLDRARAAYATRQGEGSVTITLDNSAGTFAPRHPGDALADALRNAYTTGQLGLLHERVVDLLDDDTPREDPMGRLVDALFAARHKPTPPGLGSPPPRAQDEPGCTCYPSGFSPGTYEGPMRDCPVHGELSAEARP